MIYPSVNELTKEGEINRYELVIATAKCARKITDEYVTQRELAEKAVASKETDKSVSALVTKEFRDDKAVRTAINRLQSGEYEIYPEGTEVPEDKRSF